MIEHGAPPPQIPYGVGQWEHSADNGGTPQSPSGESASTGSLDHLDGGGPLSIMLARTSDSSPTPRRCDCVDVLRRLAEHEATGSRDFGRGYMHAVRTLERPIQAAG